MDEEAIYMSEIKLISPMLDHFVMGEPFSDRCGIRCCPAMDNNTGDKYIVKIISMPSNPEKLDAMLLAGAFDTKESAVSYFGELANAVAQESEILNQLSESDGFIGFDGCQVVPMEDGNGYDIYLLSPYRRTLQKQLKKEPITHLSAINLGLDICAALAASRRNGYLYVDLKPENIYIAPEGGFRIGDIGFLTLDELKYVPLPDRYRSAFTAPEAEDPYAPLNSTLDVYAMGLILYMVYNGGTLPAITEGEPISAPEFADYEMSEIILKACAAAPEDRWQDPVEMGQALVSYMQRNGAEDTPIVSIAVPEETVAEAEEAGQAQEEDRAADGSRDVVQADDEPVSEDTQAEENAEDTAGEITESAIYEEDDNGNLTFIDNTDSDETAPGTDEDDYTFEQVSVDTAEILDAVDELLSMTVPEPVVAPEPIMVQLPETPDAEDADEKEDASVSDASEESEEVSETESETLTDDISDSDEDGESEETDEQVEDTDETDATPVTHKKHWVRTLVIIGAILALLAGGVYFYLNYYLQGIESVVLQGNESELTVLVNSDIDESLLVVVCSDTYGNRLEAPVVNGKATFTDLAPDSAYTIEVLIKGFHRLTGDTSKAYTTPVRTTIMDFSAVTGSQNGSAILRFTVEGLDAENWIISYFADGEEKQEIGFSGHILEVSGLTVGKEYTFEIAPVDSLYIYGETTLKYVASNIVLADDLVISGIQNGKLTVNWASPADTDVASWTVHCYNDKNYDKTIVTDSCTAEFDGIKTEDPYTVEVTAAGMSTNQRAFVKENAIPISDFNVISTTPTQTLLSWKPADGVTTANWVLQYSADDSPICEIAGSAEPNLEIGSLVPGATYRFELFTAEGASTVGGVLYYHVPTASEFDNYGITKSVIELQMCKTPAKSNWNRYNLLDSDYKTEFAVGEKASFLIHLKSSYNTSSDLVTTMYVIRNVEGKIVLVSATSDTWTNMWYRNYGEFDIPALPDAAGSYSVSVFFDGALAGVQSFTIVQ